MTKGNEATPKAVRDLKGQPEQPTEQATPQQNQIQIHPGNTAVLTVQFLNQINEKLYAIQKLLEKDNG